MFSKLFFWAFIALVAVLGCSEINFESSIYKEDENSLEIIFPQWQTDEPWLYFYWTPGTVKWHKDPPEEEMPSLPNI